MRSVDLRRANLAHTILNNADLEGADLSKTNLAWADAQRVSFKNTNLSWSNMMYIDASSSNFENTGEICEFEVWGVRLYHLKSADFAGSDMTLARFGGPNLEKAKLRDSNLDHAYFSAPQLKETDFTGAYNTRSYQIQFGGTFDPKFINGCKGYLVPVLVVITVNTVSSSVTSAEIQYDDLCQEGFTPRTPERTRDVGVLFYTVYLP